MKYRIIYQKRKSIRIEVTKDLEILVKAPHRTPNDAVEALILKHKDWIRERTKLIKAQESETVFQQKYHYLGGLKYEAVLKDDGEMLELIDHKIYLNQTSDHQEVKKRLREKQLSAYQPIVEESFMKMAKQMDVTFSKVAIKNMKSRWGSCSQKGSISLNVRLALAPREIIDYVIIHELAHRKYMHHQASFWNFVSRYDKNYEAHRAWLKEHGHTLIW